MANTIGLQAIIDVTQFNQGLRLYIKGMLDMTQATQKASAQINTLGVAASAGLGAALGGAAIQAVTTLVHGLRGMAEQIVENTSNFDGLAISLNFFAARALQAKTDIPLKEALAATTVEAQGLLLWVERLATLSPFTAEQVGNAFRTAQAYGLSLAAAQKLVPLLIDFAAVNRLSPELLQRVALAMAQIQARGKLASQEINQLANAGLPIRDLLVESLGVTRGELEKMLEEGLIPASVAIQAVTGYLEDFDGAAERVTRGTLQGILSSLQDIRDISSRDIFGPLLKAFFPLLNSVIDIGNSTKFKAGIRVLGQELGEGLAARIRLATSQAIILANAIATIPAPVLQATAIFVGFGVVLTAFTAIVGLLAAAITVLINPFTIVIALIAGFVTAYSINFKNIREVTTTTSTVIGTAFNAIGRTISSVMASVISILSSATSSIGDLAGTVIEYGSNVVEAFVGGIMGAMGLLTDAMQFIGSVLQFWLAPGSPPRVAPELDKWGTESGNVWLKGWLGADFEILSGIAGEIGNVLSSLVSAGKLDELSAPRILRALRTQLATAIGEFREFGKVSEDTLNKVAQSAGPASQQVKDLFKAYVNLALQSEAVLAIQNKLNEITERYSAILNPLQKKLRDISELRQQADEQKEILSLNRLIANSGVSQARKQAASARIQEIMLSRQIRGIENKQDAEQSAAEIELKAAQKREETAKAQLDRTKALIEVQNEQLNLYGQELQILEKIRKEEERRAREARQKMLEALKKQLEIAQLLQAELKDTVAVFKAQHTLADGTATAAEKAAAALELQAVLGRRIVRDFEATELGISPQTIQDIRDTLITLEDIGIKGSPFEGLSDDIFGAQEDTKKLVDEMNKAMQDIRIMFEDTREEIDSFLTGINDMLPSFLKFRKAVVGADSSLSDNIRTARAATEEYREWPPLFKTLSTAFSGIAAGLITSRVLTTLPKLLLGLGGPVGIVTALVSVLASAWAGDWFNIRQVAADSVAFITKLFSTGINSETFQKFTQDVTNQLNLARDAVLLFVSTIQTAFSFVLEPLLNEGISLDAISKSFGRLRVMVQILFRNVKSDISEEARSTAQNIGTSIRTFLETYWNPFLAALLLSSSTIARAIGTIFSEIGKTFPTLLTLAQNVFRLLLPIFKAGLGTVPGIASAAFAPINSVILNALGGLGHAIAAIIAAPFKVLGKVINLDDTISFIAEQFTTGLISKISKSIPVIGKGMIGAFVTLGSLISKSVGLIASSISTAIAELAISFTRNLLPVFLSGGKAAGSFLVTVSKIGDVLSKSFVGVFEQFKTIGPVVANAFSGLGKGLRSVSIAGAIKTLDFFEGLSKGILTFAGKGQSVLGKALAGIFQGAFKGITGGLLKTPGLLLNLFKGFNPLAIVKGIGGLFGGIKRIAGAFGGLLNPLNLLISAIDFFGFAFNNNIDGVDNRARSFVTSLKQVFADLVSGKLWQDIVANAGKAFTFLTDIWTEFQTNGINSPKLKEMLLNVGTIILDWVTTTGSTLLTDIREFWLPIFGLWIKETIENLGTTLGHVAIFVRDFLVTAGTFLAGVIAEAWSFFWTWWSESGGQEQTLTWLQGVLDLVWGWITTSAEFIRVNFIDNWLPAFIDWIIEATPGLLTNLFLFLGALVGWLLTVGLPWLVTTTLDLAAALINWIGPAIGQGIIKLGEWIGALITWIIADGIPLLVLGVAGLVTALIGWISGDGEDTAAKKAPNALTNFLTALTNFIVSDIIPALITVGNTLSQAVWDGFTQLWDKIMLTEPGIEFGKLQAKITEQIPILNTLGGGIGQAIWDGISQALSVAFNPVGALLNNQLVQLLTKGADEIEAHSPSALAQRLIGDPIRRGIEEGIGSLNKTDLFETAKLVDQMYALITKSTDAFLLLIKTDFTTFSAAMIAILTDLNSKSSLLWDDIRFDAIANVTTMRTTIITDLGTFNESLTTAMLLVKNTIVDSFELAKTESVTKVQGMAKAILGVLIGVGANDTTSVTFQIKTAMDEAGRTVGRAFVAGLVFVFGDDDSLNPLWIALDLLVDNIVARINTRLATGGVAGISGGVAGIASTTSQFDSRPGTFMPSNMTNVTFNNHYHLNVSSAAQSQGIISDFGILKTLNS